MNVMETFTNIPDWEKRNSTLIDKSNTNGSTALLAAAINTVVIPITLINNSNHQCINSIINSCQGRRTPNYTHFNRPWVKHR
jgi:hypothetical protein